LPRKPRRKKKSVIPKKKAFLAAFKICASLTQAAAAIGRDKSCHYDWLAKDAKYAASFEAAKLEAAQSLEDEAVYRSRVGVYEPNVYQGQFVYPREQYVVTPGVAAVEAVDWKEPGGAVAAVDAVAEVLGWRDVPGAMPLGTWKKSDGLLMFLLRGFMPVKYRQQGSLEVSGVGGGPIEIGIVERLNAARNRLAAQKVELKPE
jgi:hypothetical protein